MIPTTPLKEYQLSRLMLGTAQFGWNYGLANKTGKPSYQSVLEILTCAWEGGVNCLDTAAAYGESEEIVGRALADLKIADPMVVVTKVPAMADPYSSPQAIDRFVEESVARSLKRLRLSVLPICLFHSEKDYRYIDALLKMKERGLVRHVGVSCAMNPGPAAVMVNSGKVEALQIPTNMLDLRYRKSGIFDMAKRNGVAVFVRSVYLQGVIMMAEEDMIPQLKPLIPVRQKLRQIACEAGLSIAEMALRYVLSIDGVTCVLTGVESVAQVKDNITLFQKGSLDPFLVKAIIDAVPDLPENALSPHLWPQDLIYKGNRAKCGYS